MAGGHGIVSSANFAILLILNVYLHHQTSSWNSLKACSLHINARLDRSLFPGRNSGLPRRSTIYDEIPGVVKITGLLKLTKMCLWSSLLLLVAGDICPQPGPINSTLPNIDIKTRGLSVVHLNIRSLRPKRDELITRLRNSKPIDVLTFSETWFQPGISDGEICIPGYTCIRHDRTSRSGGGVVIYCRDGLPFVEREDLKNGNESVWIQIDRKKCKSLVIGCLYKPPDQPTDEFLENFNSSLTGIDPLIEKIILGDFNIDFSKNANSPLKKGLMRIADYNGLSQLIKKPTRVTEKTRTIIDLIFTDTQHKIKDQGVIPLGLSDHFLIYCVFKSGVIRSTPRIIEFRSFKNYNKAAFIKDLKNVPWHLSLADLGNLDDCIYIWNKLFTDVMNEHAPIKSRRSSRPLTPWMTPEIAKLMSDRDFHLKKAMGNKSGQHWRSYKNLRNSVHRYIEEAKSSYFTNLLQECKGDSTKLWKAFKQVLPTKQTLNISSLKVNNQTFSTDKSIADAFNKYFVSIGNKIAECFTSESETERQVNETVTCENAFTLDPITEEFVSMYINQLKSNKATGLDKISARMLKDAVSVITPSLTQLFNTSIQSGIFPTIWKNARIVPTYKSGNKHDPSNYRPISILPTVSKILEKAIHIQLSSFLDLNKLLTTSQFGFRFNSSTVLATTKFCDKVLQSMDDGELTGAVFLDLSKAFDTVNHKLLLQKLRLIGADEHACKWFGSFLSGRLQVTVYNNVLSDTSHVSIGVAQGSILGPLLFIIYMNDMPNIFQSCQVTLFADDTVLYCSSKSPEVLQQKLNSDLSRVCDWLKVNQLTINVTKSKFMLIGSSIRLSRLSSSLSVSIGDVRLEEVQSYKYLGVIINNNLTWHEHIDHIKSKINKKLGLLKRIKNYLPIHSRLLFYNSYILPIFDYADIVWGDRGNATLMSDLQVLQNKAALIILDLDYRSSATAALDKLSWKCLKDRRSSNRSIFIFKCQNNLLSHDFEITYSQDVHKYNTRSKSNIRKSIAKRNWGHWKCINFASNDWNGLVKEIRESKDLISFKRFLRKT